MKLYVFGKFEFRSILFEWKIRQLRPAFSLLSFRYLFISNFFSCERERENRWKFRSRSATNAFPFLHDVSDDNERRWLRTNLSIFRIQFWSKFDFRFYRRRQSAGPCRARFSLSFACIAKFVYCSVPWTSAPRRSRALRSIFLCKFMVILFDAFIEFIFGWVFHELKQQSYRNLRWHRVQMPHDLDRHSPADKEDKKNKTRHHKIYREGIKHENFVCVASLFQELHNFVSFAAADGAARSVWHLLFRFRHKWKCGTHVPGASAATIPICQLKQAIIHFVIFHYIQPVSEMKCMLLACHTSATLYVLRISPLRSLRTNSRESTRVLATHRQHTRINWTWKSHAGGGDFNSFDAADCAHRVRTEQNRRK